MSESKTATLAVRPKPVPSTDYPNAPTIMLGDLAWPIPLLAPRQNRIVEPRIIPFMQLLLRVYARLGEVYAEMQKGAAANIPEDFKLLDDKQYEDALDIVTAALTRAHPNFRKDDLLDMDGVTSMSLLTAMSVILQQTGIFVLKKQGAQGEPAAGEPSSRSTGIGS